MEDIQVFFLSKNKSKKEFHRYRLLQYVTICISTLKLLCESETFNIFHEHRNKKIYIYIMRKHLLISLPWSPAKRHFYKEKCPHKENQVVIGRKRKLRLNDNIYQGAAFMTIKY